MNSPSDTNHPAEVLFSASVGSAEEAAKARACAAWEVGLLRSECLFASGGTGDLTDPSVQFQAYRAVCEAAGPLRVKIRLFDVGGEKLFPWVPRVPGAASPLGVRGVRMFQEPAFSGFFRAQVQAIGELSHGNEIAVIVPFATNTNDIALVRNSLSEFGARPIPVGVMLETPALAFSIPELATAADFVVIDTNDLMQCFFGADRSLNAMAQYLEPYSLSFFRFLQGLAKSLAEFRIPNQICGQLALQPHMAAVLVGLGFNNFTIEPSAIPALRSLIEASDTQKLQAAVHELMRSDPSELRSKMEQLFQPQTS